MRRGYCARIEHFMTAPVAAPKVRAWRDLRGRVLAARGSSPSRRTPIQLGFMPLFVGGARDGFDAALDVAVGAAMIALVGWHWAFLPAFALELFPASTSRPRGRSRSSSRRGAPERPIVR